MPTQAELQYYAELRRNHLASRWAIGLIGDVEGGGDSAQTELNTAAITAAVTRVDALEAAGSVPQSVIDQERARIDALEVGKASTADIAAAVGRIAALEANPSISQADLDAAEATARTASETADAALQAQVDQLSTDLGLNRTQIANNITSLTGLQDSLNALVAGLGTPPVAISASALNIGTSGQAGLISPAVLRAWLPVETDPTSIAQATNNSLGNQRRAWSRYTLQLAIRNYLATEQNVKVITARDEFTAGARVIHGDKLWRVTNATQPGETPATTPAKFVQIFDFLATPGAAAQSFFSAQADATKTIPAGYWNFNNIFDFTRSVGNLASFTPPGHLLLNPGNGRLRVSLTIPTPSSAVIITTFQDDANPGTAILTGGVNQVMNQQGVHGMARPDRDPVLEIEPQAAITVRVTSSVGFEATRTWGPFLRVERI